MRPFTLLTAAMLIFLLMGCSTKDTTRAKVSTGAASEEQEPISIRYQDGGVPMVRINRLPGDRFYHHPVFIGKWGSDHYTAYRKAPHTEEGKRHLRKALIAAEWCVENQQAGGMWMYHFDFPVSGTGKTMRAPWASALAQGRAIGLLARAHEATGKYKYLQAAERAITPLEQPISQGGLSAPFLGEEEHPFYEEYPMDPPNHTLNGFISTLIALKELEDENPASRAGSVYEAGLKTLVRALPEYDREPITPYHLAHITDPPREPLALQTYHDMHIALLTRLNTYSPHPALEYYAERWASY
jgi:heparosan-N-sulfate-glucuronate 5-epimerase